ncbi:hypothetical protein [Brachyspira sp.]|uniref:hypothetical protein n=1 Tax=Brachyspira sp. TaxID=1977261 RepID=UPI003D7DD130
MIKTIKNILLFAFIIILFSCEQKIKTVNLGNFSVEIPENFERGFLNDAINTDSTVIDYETYGIETKTAIYGIEYSKYRFSVNIENIKNSIINNLRNHSSLREYKIVSEGYANGKNNCYEVLSSFYYGPNLTYNKSFIMINNGNEVIKISCMYNANSKADDKRINNIIASVRLTNN